jgi:uncharacterized protein with HEPN domain
MRSDANRLQDMLEAIERIERHAASGKDAFYQDELLQTWILHHLLIIGEACRALSQEFRDVHKDEIWANAAGLRNVIVHHYFGVDREVVWGVVEQNLPTLKSLVQGIIAKQS